MVEYILANLKDCAPEELCIYGTRERPLKLDACHILKDACVELHDDAFYEISQRKRDELPSFLDMWAESVQDGTITFLPDYEVEIVLEVWNLQNE